MFMFLLLVALASPFGCVSHHASSTSVDRISKIFNSHQKLSDYQKQARNATVRLLTDRGVGTGTYVKYNGEIFILTAAHVVQDASSVSILMDSHVVPTDVIYIDPDKDICALRAKTLVHPIEVRIEPIEIVANTLSSIDNIGRSTYYSGYPFNHTKLSIFGIVSGIQQGSYIIQSYGWPGTSGSLVLDGSDSVLGILSAVDFTDFPSPQLVETIVWVSPVSDSDLQKIIESLQEL